MGIVASCCSSIFMADVKLLHKPRKCYSRCRNNRWMCALSMESDEQYWRAWGCQGEFALPGCRWVTPLFLFLPCSSDAGQMSASPSGGSATRWTTAATAPTNQPTAVSHIAMAIHHPSLLHDVYISYVRTLLKGSLAGQHVLGAQNVTLLTAAAKLALL